MLTNTPIDLFRSSLNALNALAGTVGALNHTANHTASNAMLDSINEAEDDENNNHHPNVLSRISNDDDDDEVFFDSAGTDETVKGKEEDEEEGDDDSGKLEVRRFLRTIN